MINYTHNLIEMIRARGLEQFGRFYSTYRGKVVDNKDPQKRGRVKVVIPQIFGDGDPDKKALNWADPKDFRNFGPNKGEFYPPDVGDYVFIEFEGGDLQFPIYSGGYPAQDETADEFVHGDDDAPLVRGFKDKYGNGFYFDQTEGEEKVVFTTTGGHFLILDDTAEKETIYIKHKSGAQIQINPKGSVNVFAKNGSVIAVNAEKNTLTLQNQTGALINIDDGLTISDASGKTLLTMTADTFQAVTAKNLVLQGNTATISAGATTIGDSVTKLSIGSGKVSLGTSAVEVVDQIIKIVDAILNDPAPYVTGVGPTSPLVGTSKVQLTLVKTLLTTIKG